MENEANKEIITFTTPYNIPSHGLSTSTLLLGNIDFYIFNQWQIYTMPYIVFIIYKCSHRHLSSFLSYIIYIAMKVDMYHAKLNSSQNINFY